MHELLLARVCAGYYGQQTDCCHGDSIPPKWGNVPIVQSDAQNAGDHHVTVVMVIAVPALVLSIPAATPINSPQNAHAYVNAGFRLSLDPASLTVRGVPSLVFGGVSEHAVGPWHGVSGGCGTSPICGPSPPLPSPSLPSLPSFPVLCHSDSQVPHWQGPK